MVTAIIIEDEKNVGIVMQRMIESNHRDIKVATICFNISEAEEALNKFKPGLVFLDIELGKSQTCFDLLKKKPPVDLNIIFTTAYNRFAMQALKLSAVDYLLKPIDQNELDRLVEKFRLKKLYIDAIKMEDLLTAWVNPGNQRNKLHFSAETVLEPVTIADIIYCEGINGQTSLLLNNQTKIPVDMTLKECENILTPYKFYRIHKSFLINLAHVKRYVKSKNGIAVMSNNATLQVAKSFNDKIFNKLQTSRMANSI